ncbi:MAG: PQQ-like beta-propeller repeat protein [Chloroflexi bacterium]|nr:PQQ-like beta-propeller repeat protein [Chloroflexota bacterium]MCC6895603.1 PQQ-like beta-propeller repeat protein [Anaerolineae bacterium]
MRQFLARRTLWGALVLFALAVAACGPAPLGTGWPSVSLFNSVCNGTTSESILVAYTDRIVQVNPVDGKAVVLKNADCENRPPDSEGKLRAWDFRPSGKQFYSAPVPYDDTTMLAIAYDQHIYKIDNTLAQANGEPTAIDGITGHSVTDLVASDDLIYVALSAKDVVALDRDTLDVKWKFTTEHGVWGKPLLQDGTLYFSSLDHHLYAVDADSGSEKWKLDIGGAATSSPLFYEGELYIGSFARAVFEISTDGQILNQQSTVDWVWSTPVVADGILYVADLGGSVYAFDTAENLQPVWQQKVATRAIRATPLVVGDVILVASRDQKLYWLNRADGTSIIEADGKPLVRELQGEILSDILLIEPGEGVDIPKPYVVVGTTSTSQILVAYALDNGESKWSYSFQ